MKNSSEVENSYLVVSRTACWRHANAFRALKLTIMRVRALIKVSRPMCVKGKPAFSKRKNGSQSEINLNYCPKIELSFYTRWWPQACAQGPQISRTLGINSSIQVWNKLPHSRCLNGSFLYSARDKRTREEIKKLLQNNARLATKRRVAHCQFFWDD